MVWICSKCRVNAKKIVLDKYEYIEGIPLHNVEGYQCPKCKELFFDEKQAEAMDKASEEIKAHAFAFNRRITISGRSLVINLPEDLAKHMNLAKGEMIKLQPLDHKRFLVELTE